MEWEVKVDMAEYMCPKIHVIANVFNKEKKKHLGRKIYPNANFLEWGGMWWFRPPCTPN